MALSCRLLVRQGSHGKTVAQTNDVESAAVTDQEIERERKREEEEELVHHHPPRFERAQQTMSKVMMLPLFSHTHTNDRNRSNTLGKGRFFPAMIVNRFGHNSKPEVKPSLTRRTKKTS
jgi:hypothetical protein